MYRGTRLVIKSSEERLQIIKDVHEGIGDDSRARAMASHRGRDTTYQKIMQRFFWFNIMDGVANFVKHCDTCQRQGKIQSCIAQELQSVPVPTAVMNQIGIDICNLPEVDGYKHLIVCIDYFSKWSEAKPVKDKSAVTVTSFLYDVICRHGCIKIQINDQGREFVNQVSSTLHKMTGVEQRITSAYHPQSNGLCERQNRSIKDSLIKVLNEKAEEWPYVIDGILFAHRVSVHTSTKYSPFYLLYNRHPTLPIDVKYDLDGGNAGGDLPNDTSEDGSPFSMETFEAVMSSTLSLRDLTLQAASANIKDAQKRQKKDYDRRHTLPATIQVNSMVLLKNQKRADRKGGKFTYKWTGPYEVQSITMKGLCKLKNKDGAVLSKSYNVSLLKPYQDPNEANEYVPDEKPPTSGENISDEKPAEENTEVSWDILPDEIMEMIILYANSGGEITTYNSLMLTCQRFQRILSKSFGRIYVQFPDDVKKKLSTMYGKIKVSMRMIVKTFGQSSGLALSLKEEVIRNRKWRSAWLILRAYKIEHGLFDVERVYWKSPKCAIVVDDDDEKDDAGDDLWLQNDLYNLKEADQNIILSETAWFNDRIMDAAQKIICKALGLEYQSVLNIQNRSSSPFYPVIHDEHLQILHDGSNHWLLSFSSNGRVQICDSLGNTLSRLSMKCIKSLYKHCVNDGRLSMTFLPVQKQSDGYNCGPFAIAYAAEVLDGKSPIDARFDVSKMRDHVMLCLENKVLTPFPKVTEN